VKKAKYALTLPIEKQAVLAELTTPRFHDVLGHAIDSERMPSTEGAMLISAGQAVSRLVGGCTSPDLALQHLRSLSDQGKVTLPQIDAASAWLQGVQVQDVDSLIAVVSPAVAKAAQQEALELGLKSFAQGEDASAASEAMEKAAAIGKRKQGLGTALGGDLNDIVATVANSGLRDPLPTGIPELDLKLSGGMERPALGVAMAGTGVGKTLYLCHVTTQALMDKRNVLYVTLEVTESTIKQRVYQNLLGMTEEEIREKPQEAARRFKMLAAPGIGQLRVCYATPRTTSLAFLKSLLRDLDKEHGFQPDVIMVDYADKLVVSVGRQKKSSYEEMDEVYDGLQTIAKENDVWVWTASQLKRGANRGKRITVDDVSDSMQKMNNADLVVGIYQTEQDEEESMVRFCVPKRRVRETSGEVGPLPQDKSRGRIVAVNRFELWGYQ
jgi:archaellum biogenesis ATPase FlaH